MWEWHPAARCNLQTARSGGEPGGVCEAVTTCAPREGACLRGGRVCCATARRPRACIPCCRSAQARGSSRAAVLALSVAHLGAATHPAPLSNARRAPGTPGGRVEPWGLMHPLLPARPQRLTGSAGSAGSHQVAARCGMPVLGSPEPPGPPSHSRVAATATVPCCGHSDRPPTTAAGHLVSTTRV